MNRLAILGIGCALVFFVGLSATAVWLLSISFYDHEEFFQVAGDGELAEEILDGVDTEDWHTFFVATQASGKAFSFTVEKNRFVNALADPGKNEYRGGEVRLKLTLKDLRTEQELLNKTFEEPLPMAVIKHSGESAQEAAYREAERKLLKRLDRRMGNLVYAAMMGYPEQRETFLPVLEARISDEDALRAYAAGEAAVTLEDEAVPVLVRASLASPKNDIVCANLIKKLTITRQDSIPPLKPLLKHPSEKVRGAVVILLSQFMAEDKVSTEIVLAALEGKNAYVQQQALVAIKALGPEGGEVAEVRQALMSLVKDGEKRTSERAMDALASMGEPALSDLLAALKEESLHRDLAEALVRETPEEARLTLMPLLLELRGSGNAIEKKGVEAVLSYWPSNAQRSFYAALQHAFQSEDRETRSSVLSLLEGEARRFSGRGKQRSRLPSAGRSAAKVILMAAMEDKDPGIQERAAELALTTTQSGYSSDLRRKALIHELKQAPATKRWEILRKITPSALSQADIPFFLTLAESAETKIATTAIRLLLGNPKVQPLALPPLIKRLPNLPFDSREEVIKTLCGKDLANRYLPVIFKEAWDPGRKR
ncbi:MAG: HEAT repeat domain-containing protein, partial [Planctomycetota bacterium]